MREYSKRLWGLCNSSSWPDLPHLNLSGTGDKDIIARSLSSALPQDPDVTTFCFVTLNSSNCD